MTKEILNEREFELINIIGPQIGANQRDISKQMKVSLGMVNMLIRRLISKGFIRMKQLNKKKVEYILTSKGFSEKMRKSVKYTMKTLNSISIVKATIQKVIVDLYEQGERDFIVFGKSDFALLIEMIIKELNFNVCAVTFVDELPLEGYAGTLLICKELDQTFVGNGKCVDLVREISKDNQLINNQIGD